MAQGAPGGIKWRFEFPAMTRSVPVSRHLMADLLSDSLSEQELDVVLLVASELVTNAILHTADSFELTVRLLSGFVEIEVADSDRHTPTLRAPTPEMGSGRGLGIVEALAEAWGVKTHELGKAVWFRVPSTAGWSGALN
jgi:anti-sigma regulatory factor (Ser/Thr protein kinase)